MHSACPMAHRRHDVSKCNLSDCFSTEVIVTWCTHPRSGAAEGPSWARSWRAETAAGLRRQAAALCCLHIENLAIRLSDSGIRCSASFVSTGKLIASNGMHLPRCAASLCCRQTRSSGASGPDCSASYISRLSMLALQVMSIYSAMVMLSNTTKRCPGSRQCLRPCNR